MHSFYLFVRCFFFFFRREYRRVISSSEEKSTVHKRDNSLTSFLTYITLMGRDASTAEFLLTWKGAANGQALSSPCPLS
jgi:hypothetical protein